MMVSCNGTLISQLNSFRLQQAYISRSDTLSPYSDWVYVMSLYQRVLGTKTFYGVAWNSMNNHRDGSFLEMARVQGPIHRTTAR